MPEFAKTPVHNVVSLRTIVTVFRSDLTGKKTVGEAHTFPELFFVEEGRAKTLVDGTPFELEAGQMILYAPNAFHGAKEPLRNPPGTVDIISFETEAPLPGELYNRVITLSGDQRVRLTEIIQMALPLFEKRIAVRGMMLKNHVDPYILQEVKNRMELFLLELLKPAEKYPMTRMRSITDYLTKNLNRVLTLEEMSRDLGYSVSVLKRQIKETVGLSPMAYFMDLKMEEAKRLLTHSPLSITEIALQLGFSSVHHFSRQFKQKTGVSPTDYKNQSS